VSAGAIGVVLGIVGYFMGARRLAVATITLSIVAIFFGLAASQGIIPRFRGLRSRTPRGGASITRVVYRMLSRG
jgi:hypothetical protein